MLDLMSQSAEGLANLERTHAELALPHHPRLVTDLAFFSQDGALEVAGLRDRLRLKGDGVVDLFAELMPLLDGRNTLDVILAHWPASDRDALRSILCLLHIHECLEDGAATIGPLAHFYARYLGITGANTSGGTAVLRLQAARVSLDMDDPALLATFRAAGLRVKVRDDSADLIVRHIDDMRPLPSAKPVLFVGPERSVVGPLTYFGDSACPVCAAAQLPDNAAVAVADVNALAAHEIQIALSGVFRPRTRDGILKLTSQSPAPVHEKVTRQAGCPCCGDPTLPAQVSQVITGHNAVAVRRWMPQEKAGFRTHIRPDIVALTIPQARISPTGQHDVSVRPLLDAHLLPVLQGACGLQYRTTTGSMRRVTASAGNLGSSEVLVRTQGHTYAPFDPMSGGLGADKLTQSNGPDLLLQGAFHRVAAKYGGRAVAYTLLDAGVMLSRLSRLLRNAGRDHVIDTGPGVARDGQTDLFPAGIHLGLIPSAPDRPKTDDGLRATFDGPDMPFALDRLPGRRALVPTGAPEPGLTDTIAARQSGGIRRGQMTTAMFDALTRTMTDHAPWVADDHALTCVIATDQIDGYADGLWQVGPNGNLHCAGHLRQSDLLANALLQDEHRQGHMFIFIGTDLAARCSQMGPAGYKLALLEAGWLVDNLCLTAARLGLPATPSGGFPPLLIKERLAPFGVNMDPLIGFVVGGA